MGAGVGVGGCRVDESVDEFAQPSCTPASSRTRRLVCRLTWLSMRLLVPSHLLCEIADSLSRSRRQVQL